MTPKWKWTESYHPRPKMNGIDTVWFWSGPKWTPVCFTWLPAPFLMFSPRKVEISQNFVQPSAYFSVRTLKTRRKIDIFLKKPSKTPRKVDVRFRTCAHLPVKTTNTFVLNQKAHIFLWFCASGSWKPSKTHRKMMNRWGKTSKTRRKTSISDAKCRK